MDYSSVIAAAASGLLAEVGSVLGVVAVIGVGVIVAYKGLQLALRAMLQAALSVPEHGDERDENRPL